MEYKIALEKAWKELEQAAEKRSFSVRLLNDTYSVDLGNKSIISDSCNVAAKDHISILLIHYLIKKQKVVPPLKGDWISFKELVGGQGYYPTFKKRVLQTIVRKYGEKPDTLLGLAERFRAKKVQLADVSVVLDTFEESVPVLLSFWRGDDEFGPEANMLYDKSITEIFCTEDIIVLSEVVAHSI